MSLRRVRVGEWTLTFDVADGLRSPASRWPSSAVSALVAGGGGRRRRPGLPPVLHGAPGRDRELVSARSGESGPGLMEPEHEP